MGRSRDYIIQSGCWNCKKHFIRSDYDEVDTIYCTDDRRERPCCNSILMNESIIGYLKSKCIDLNNGKEYGKVLRKWERWSKSHTVNFSGICSKYERNK